MVENSHWHCSGGAQVASTFQVLAGIPLLSHLRRLRDARKGDVQQNSSTFLQVTNLCLSITVPLSLSLWNSFSLPPSLPPSSPTRLSISTPSCPYTSIFFTLGSVLSDLKELQSLNQWHLLMPLGRICCFSHK